MTDINILDTMKPRTATILVVDDDAVTLKVCATLDAAGCCVMTASGSSEAQQLPMQP